MLEELFKPRSLVEIAILAVAYYAVLSAIRGTRGAGILKGLAVFVIVAFVGAVWVADRLGLEQIKQMLTWLLSGSYIAAIVIFAPEMRRALLRLAQTPFLTRLMGAPSLEVVDAVVAAAAKLSKNRVGALIAFEREVGLGDYVEKGSRLDSAVTADLLETIFYPGNPIHDGAVIIQHGRIAAAACYFPLTEDESLARSMGTRHRAALGVCEETDAVVVVVSEETGRITLCAGAKMQVDLSAEELSRQLKDLLSRPDRPTLGLRRKGPKPPESGPPAPPPAAPAAPVEEKRP